MGARSSTINPTQDFLARMGGGRLFDMGASTVKYGSANLELEPGSKMRNEIGDSGACALADALRVKKSLKTMQ